MTRRPLKVIPTKSEFGTMVTDKGVLVQEIPFEEEKSKGGIIIPDSAKGKDELRTFTAIVIAIAEDVTKVKVGDRIMYQFHTGAKVKIKGREYLFLRENNILFTNVPE